MKLVFDDSAIIDLENIYNWIAQDSPAAALKVVRRLLKSADRLVLFPHMGHAGQETDFLEWVVPQLPYILVYQVDEAGEQVIVAAVLHGAQDR